MKNKGIEWLRVIIFTAIANAIGLAYVYLLDDMINKNSFFIMFAPTTAHILTRLITREKFDTEELMLHAHLKGNIKYYLYTVLFTFLSEIISVFMLVSVFIKDYKLSDYFSKDNMSDVAIIIFMSIGTSFTAFFVCFGEEFGWRAYLTPKLEKLVPEPLALVISGIIWGMWHAPVIKSAGLNFGTGYKFFPYAGYIAMSIFAIFIGSFLTWLTKKTGSVYPASICHNLIDSLNLYGLLLPQKFIEKTYQPGQLSFNSGVVSMSSGAVLGAVFFVILCIESNKKRKSEKI